MINPGFMFSGLLLCFCLNLFSLSKQDTTKFLQIKIAINKGEEVLSDYRILVFCNNDTVETQKCSVVGKVWLAKNKNYVIEISKFGYQKRLLLIETFWENPLKAENAKVSYKHSIEIKLEKDNGQGSFYEDFPIGLIQYNFEKDEFVSNVKFSQQAKKELLGEKNRRAKKKN